MSEVMLPVSFYLPPDQLRRLDRMAYRMGVSRSTVTRECALMGMAAMERKARAYEDAVRARVEEATPGLLGGEEKHGDRYDEYLQEVAEKPHI